VVLLASEQRRIQWICGFPVFNPKKDVNDEYGQIRKLSAFELMPDEKRYKKKIAIEYNHKVLCRIAAGGDYHLRQEFYEELPASEVWEQIALNMAVNH